MPPPISAGLLLYRHGENALEVFLGHPGGPFWSRKDLGAWSIPKGEVGLDEDHLAAAIREFEEETGYRVAGTFRPLIPIRQAGGKVVHAWAVEGDIDAAGITSNTFSLEWPPRSGRLVDFPELDRAEWFSLEEARTRILKGQLPFLGELTELLSDPPIS